MYLLNTASAVYMRLSCSKQPPMNSTLILVPTLSKFGLSLLLVVAGDLMTSSDNPLDFHEEILLFVSPVVFKYFISG